MRMALYHRLIIKAARLWWRIRRPRTLGVRALLHDADGRIALVRHTYMPHWYLPGGGVDKGESVATALHREVAEEVGLTDIHVERIVGVYHNVREGKDDHVVLFAASVPAAQVPRLHPADPREIAEARWFAADALPADLSPATRRRIAEYRSGAVGMRDW
ncbi:hypothetical protein NX02_03720 [Sphingomonas sanxanigenens DSM 19645 = NX02]|uniref:Nudix hydrolase domain-containing protein n=2 Tax=Sphingomonas sanxanigenens TaxID=397260 RepID=W0A865_9SPHN|nr:hypothetical protein NX02_03720 [Sphingomonas sanxanigenens DSM 19645 = NX02]